MNGLVFKFERLVSENIEYLFEQQKDKMMK